MAIRVSPHHAGAVACCLLCILVAFIITALVTSFGAWNLDDEDHFVRTQCEPMFATSQTSPGCQYEQCAESRWDDGSGECALETKTETGGSCLRLYAVPLHEKTVGTTGVLVSSAAKHLEEPCKEGTRARQCPTVGSSDNCECITPLCTEHVCSPLSVQRGESAFYVKYFSGGSVVSSEPLAENSPYILQNYSGVGIRFTCWFDPDDADKGVFLSSFVEVSARWRAARRVAAVGCLVSLILFLLALAPYCFLRWKEHQSSGQQDAAAGAAQGTAPSKAPTNSPPKKETLRADVVGGKTGRPVYSTRDNTNENDVWKQGASGYNQDQARGFEDYHDDAYNGYARGYHDERGQRYEQGSEQGYMGYEQGGYRGGRVEGRGLYPDPSSHGRMRPGSSAGFDPRYVSRGLQQDVWQTGTPLNEPYGRPPPRFQ